MLTLASGSQDGYIRLWSIAAVESSDDKLPETPSAKLSEDLLDAFERSLAEVSESQGEGGRSITNKTHLFGVKGPDGKCVTSQRRPMSLR